MLMDPQMKHTPPAAKRKPIVKHKSGSGGGGGTTLEIRQDDRDDIKQLKFVSKTCSAASMEQSVFNKLDPSVPEQKRRLEQRQKMVSYGKNTAGYAEYLKQVPKEKRMKRSMETPMTPDYTLDIPNKRWQGQIRAWRQALHNYDPPDLQASLASVAQPMVSDSATMVGSPTPELSIRDQEIADAKKRGLLVDLGGPSASKTSPTSVAAIDEMEDHHEMKELDLWDTARGHDDDFDLDDGDESDDDLL